MTFNDLYREYFKHQATAHPDMAHQDAVGERVFAVIDLEDSFGDFRTAVKPKGYIFRLINYDYQIGQFSHELTKRISGGFVLAHWFQKDDQASLLTAQLNAERVTDQVIEKMIHDSRSSHPLFHHGMDAGQDINVQPLKYVGDACYVGYRCVFSWEQHWSNCTSPIESAAWTDGGTSPHSF